MGEFVQNGTTTDVARGDAGAGAEPGSGDLVVKDRAEAVVVRFSFLINSKLFLKRVLTRR